MMRFTWYRKVLPMAALLLVAAVIAACGGGSTTSDKSVAKAVSGSVTFPALNSAVAKTVAAVTPPTLEVRDLSGTLLTTVPLTLKSGTVNTYTYPEIKLALGKDYILTATRDLMVLRALVDKAAMAGTATTKDVDNVTTTAVIVVEKNLALPPGTLGLTAITASKQATLDLMPATTIEDSITAALAACNTSTGIATTSQAQLASLANIVTAAVSNNVDPSAFVAGTSAITTVTAITYTGTAVGTSGSINTDTAGTFAAGSAESLPKISSAGSTSFTVGTDGTFAITGTGTLSTSGTLPSGVAFYAATGVLSGTPAAGTNGAYTLTVTATSNGLTATQAFTLTVNPAVVAPAPVGFTTEMISGKTFAEGLSNRIKFNANWTLTASDTQDALTWSIDSSGKVVVNNTTNSSSTTITLVSGNLTSGLQVSMVHSDDNTTESITLTVATSGPQSLVGSWYVPYNSAGQAKGPIVFTFIDGTNFMMAHDGDKVADPSGQPGIESGTYTWNKATGAFTANVISDTNGEWGFSHPGEDELVNFTVSVDGNSLLLNGVAFATKVKESSISPIIGSWYVPGEGGIVHTFLDATNYMMAHDGVSDSGGRPGIERGTYSWNQGTSISVIDSVDTNGDWGFSHSSEKFTVSSDGNTLLMDGVAFGWKVNDNSRSFTSGSVTAQW